MIYICKSGYYKLITVHDRHARTDQVKVLFVHTTEELYPVGLCLLHNLAGCFCILPVWTRFLVGPGHGAGAEVFCFFALDFYPSVFNQKERTENASW